MLEKMDFRGEEVVNSIIATSQDKGRWIVDDDPSSQFPIYTRGNVGEIFAEVVKPFSWSLWGIPYCEPGWREALRQLGAFDLDEFPSDRLAMLGVFGGYCYLNVTASRIFGVRAPGLSPEAIDHSFFGGRDDVPPYAPKPTDVSAAHEAKLGETIGFVLTAEDLPELADMRQQALDLRSARPDLASMSDADLLERTRRLTRENWYPFWIRHIVATYHSMIPAGVVEGVCAAIGKPELATDILISNLPVDSALPAKALWALSRKVRASQELGAIFDAGVEGVLERIAASSHPDAAEFQKDWAQFIRDYGFRGPNEWELSSEVWEINPNSPLAALAGQAKSDEDGSPDAKKAIRDAARATAIATVEEILAADAETLAQFQMAAKSMAVFFAGRERTRSNCAIIDNEMRMPMYELGRRFVERGIFDKPSDFAYLTDVEWTAALEDPSIVAPILAERRQDEAELSDLIPPFIVDGAVPPLSSWTSRKDSAQAPLTEGEAIAGQSGCGGVVRGVARVVLDPSDPGDLEPGDILIAQHTDPSWTPIFAAVSGVVVNVGATISHAVIVARELGVPCVVSATNATDRIKSGAIIEVDGGKGTVTLISEPGA